MNKHTVLLLFFIVLASCKAKKPIVEKIPINQEIAQNPNQKVFENYNQNQLNFKTINIKANAHYEDEKNAQKVNAEIRIEKDKQILIIIRVLGISFAKAYITPTTVKYWSRANSTFFEGDYAGLSKWLGVELNFQKVQNLFFGKTFDDLNLEQFVVTMTSNLYQISQAKTTENNVNTYYLQPDFLLAKQEFEQRLKNRDFKVEYFNYKEYGNIKLPTNLTIIAHNDSKNSTIEIEYKNISLNEELDFRYNVPNGYEQIYIEK